MLFNDGRSAASRSAKLYKLTQIINYCYSDNTCACLRMSYKRVWLPVKWGGHGPPGPPASAAYAIHSIIGGKFVVYIHVLIHTCIIMYILCSALSRNVRILENVLRNLGIPRMCAIL